MPRKIQNGPPTPEAASERYVPALGLHALTPLYDPLTRLFARESTLKPALLARASIGGDHRVLDIGCGTGTLGLLARRRAGSARILGLDRDPAALRIARRKVARAGVDVALVQATSTRLPFPEESFDRVLASLMFHHLSDESKLATLAEVLRVLRSGGELHVADWGRPHNALMTLASLPMRLFEGPERVAPHVRGQFPDMVAATGFVEVEETGDYMTLMGTVTLLRARKATPQAPHPSARAGPT